MWDSEWWSSLSERFVSWRDEVGATKLTGLSVALLAAMMVAYWGSGRSSRAAGPDLVPVRGAVTFDGQPVTAGTITFIPDDAAGTVGPMSTGLLRDDGHYELLAPRGRRGAVPGRHRVTISTRTIGSDERRSARQPVPAWYAQPHTSGLASEVRATTGGPLTIDFTLTSASTPGGSSRAGSQAATSPANGPDRRRGVFPTTAE